jgi:hypothetical protein
MRSTASIGRPARGSFTSRASRRGPIALLFGEERPAAGDRRAFRFSHEIPVPGERISFSGHRRAMERVVEAARPFLAAWPSFRELAIHGLF